MLKVDCRIWSGPDATPTSEGARDPAVRDGDGFELVGFGPRENVAVTAGPGPRPPGNGGAPGWMLQSRMHCLAAPDRARELELRAEAAAGLPERFVLLDGPASGLRGGPTRAAPFGSGAPRPRARAGRWSPAGAERSARFSSDGGTAAVFDDLGRLVVLDLAGSGRPLMAD